MIHKLTDIILMNVSYVITTTSLIYLLPNNIESRVKTRFYVAVVRNSQHEKPAETKITYRTSTVDLSSGLEGGVRSSVGLKSDQREQVDSA